MATYSFTATESIGIPEQITLSDTSVSPAPGLTHRQVYFRLATGQYLNTLGVSDSPVYEIWPISDASITLNILDASTSCDVIVDWMTGNSITAEVSTDICFDEFDYLFALGLIGDQTSNPAIVQDVTYYSNFSAFIVNLFCAETAITSGSDIFSSQSFLNRNQLLIANENFYF